MFSKSTRKFLSGLRYDAKAKEELNILPFGGVFWADEMPHIHDIVKMPEKDRQQLLRLFYIRQKIWKAENLSAREFVEWNITRVQIPTWSLFHRLVPRKKYLEAQVEAEKKIELEFEALGNDDEIGSSEQQE